MEPHVLNQKADLCSPPSNKTSTCLSEQSLYGRHFGLKEKPFKLIPDPRYFYMSKQHQEALAHLAFSIQENKGFATITGEVGTGKTTLCRSFLNHLDKNIKVAYIFNPCLTDVELLQNINDELGIPSNDKSKKYLIDKLNDYLLEEKRKGNKVVLIIDEAQNLTPDVLEQLRLLSNLETETDKLIQMILVGQPELQNTLSRPGLRQLKQRITIDWELLPLNRDETSMYIQHRTKIAGGNGQLIFTRNAMGKIHDYSEGIPRLVNVLADRALIIAFALGKKQINSKIIQFAIKDLEKKRHKDLQRNKRVKGTVISGLLFLVFLCLVFLLSLSQKDTSIETVKTGAAESGIVRKADSLSKELPALSSDPPSRETPVLSTNSLPAVPPVLSKKQEFVGFLKRVADHSKTNAIAALLDIWSLPPWSPDESAQGKFSRLKEKRGLSFFRIDTDLQQLKRFNYPSILLFKPFGSQKKPFLLLIEMQDDHLTFVSNGEKVLTTREIVEKTWTGTTYIFWKDFENIGRAIKQGSHGFEVIWLSKKLKELGFYDHKITQVFNNNLKKAVLQFQKENKLKADGVVGKETKSLLYNNLGIYKTPQLLKVIG